MIRLFCMFLMVMGWSLSVSALAGDLSGFWKHADEPGWMEIRFEGDSGNGAVVRNDLYPERVGRLLLKDLTADGDQWRGQVYAEKFAEYKGAVLSLPEPDQLSIKVKVGFMSRTVNWVRVSEVPAE